MNEILDNQYADGKLDAFYQDLDNLKLKYKMGLIPKINNAEYSILEFCHNHDMREFLREEFRKHPIELDDDGCLVGENPFERERRQSKEDLGIL